MRRAIGKPPPSPPASLRRGTWLRAGALVGAVVAGATAQVDADAARWFGCRGPVCPLGACLGPLACPGCGLVRSTAASLQGDFGVAVAVHPAGPAIAVLLLGALLLHLDILRRGHECASHRRWRQRGSKLFLAAVLLGWLSRFAS